MDELDMTSIDPLRRAEVQRRVAILDRYIALKSPTIEAAATHAAEIGVGVAQFYRLAQVWRIHRDPTRLGVGRRGGRRKRRGGVVEAVKEIVASVLSEIGAGAPHEDIFRDVERRCLAAEVAAPSHGALWTYVMDGRATSPIRQGERPRLVVGRLWAKLPTTYAGEAIFPEVATAMLLPERIVLGLDVSCDPNKRASAALALARAFAAQPSATASITVLADAADVDEINAVHLAKLGREAEKSPTSVSTIMATNLGRVVGGLGILHRVHRAKAGRLLKAHSTNAIRCPDAVAEIERAFANHNAKMTMGS